MPYGRIVKNNRAPCKHHLGTLTSPAPDPAELPQRQYTPFDRERQIDLSDQRFSRAGVHAGAVEKNDASRSMVNEFETIPALECLQRNWLRFLP
jgi:hypothetical protein